MVVYIAPLQLYRLSVLDFYVVEIDNAFLCYITYVMSTLRGYILDMGHNALNVIVRNSPPLRNLQLHDV